MKLFSTLHFRFICLVLSLIATISSCKKEDPEPPLAEQIAGEYNGTYYLLGPSTKINLPATTSTGITATLKITVSKISDEIVNIQVKLTLTDKTGKASDSFSKYDGLLLKKAANGDIEGYEGTTKRSTFINGELSVGFPDPDPTKTVIFYGKKN
ncbi:MAG: hypothetical protein R2822_14555 [Spirosomataceae bacterium]